MGAVKMDWALFWFVALCFVGTLIALDNWERISAWARKRFSTPVIDIGRQRAKVTASARAQGAREADFHARPFQAESLDKQGPKGDFLAARARPLVHGVAAFISFLWRWKLPLSLLLAFMLIVGAMRSCWSPMDLGKSREELRFERELAQAEAETQAAITARDAAIAQAAQDAALSRERIAQASQRGRDEIAAATPENEEPLDPGLVAAWRGSLERLRIYGANGAGADPGGPSAPG